MLWGACELSWLVPVFAFAIGASLWLASGAVFWCNKGARRPSVIAAFAQEAFNPNAGHDAPRRENEIVY